MKNENEQTLKNCRMIEKKKTLKGCLFTDVRTLDALLWGLNFIRENDLKIYQCSDLVENIQEEVLGREILKQNSE